MAYPDESLRDGVAAKDRYGRLALPLVVAIQVIEEFRIEKIDVMNGLFGQEAFAVDAEGKPLRAGSEWSLDFADRPDSQDHQRCDGMVHA